jgi:Rps23 Pro-64 3,4-dihydroxylase Tpa1-like proline 4-hydroxylase
LEEVKGFFVAQDFPLEEGEVFYYYYQAMNWRTESGGPLRDWRSAASQWLWNLDH